MINISPFKIMVVVTVVLVLLGPDKLPEVARKAASSWRSIKQFQQKVEDEVRGTIPDLPSSNDIARIVRNPVHLLNHLATSSQGDEEIQPSSPDRSSADAITTEARTESVLPYSTQRLESRAPDPPPTQNPFDPSMN